MKYWLVAFLALLLTSCATITGSVTDEPLTVDTEGRTMGEVLDDNNLRTRLLVNLSKLDERYKKANVDIHVNAGTVLIVGQVPTDELVERATELLKDEAQVKSIHNRLSAGPNLSTRLKANDKWLAVKVRSRMFTTDYFPSSNVELVVQTGVVYLLGRVTQATAAEAVKITTEVNGVQKVVTLFELIN